MKKHSIITEYGDISAFSGKPRECDHHVIFGRGMKPLADEDGLFIPLTNAEHNLSQMGTINQIHGNPAAEKLSKMVGQLAWEKEYVVSKISESTGEPVSEIKSEAREKFMKRYGISYL